MHFRTTILQSGKNATGIVVPPEIVESLNAGKRPPVRVTVNGYTYRSSIASMGGQFLIGVSAEIREKAGVAGGDEVDVDVELDTAPRVMDVPDDLAAALAAADARARFDTLSYSNQRRLVEPILAAKTGETRQRRIEKVVSDVRDVKAG